MPGLSIKNLMNTAEQNEMKSRSDQDTEADTPLTFESMMDAWQKLAESEKAAHRKSMSTVMLLHSPGINLESATLTFFVSNGAQQDWIKENVLSRFEATMRKMLNNRKIKIDVQLYESERKEEERMYTSTEKARFLARKKPELNDFMKDLDLDVK